MIRGGGEQGEGKLRRQSGNAGQRGHTHLLPQQELLGQIKKETLT